MVRTMVRFNFHNVRIEPKLPRSCEFARETMSLFFMLKYPTFYLFKQFFKLIFIGVQLLYNIVLDSTVQ